MLRVAAVAAVLLGASAAQAQVPVAGRPVEDGTRITAFVGGRYVPHKHFDALAAASGTPVVSDTPLGPELMASFSYAPSIQLELSLEVGYASDSYKLGGTVNTTVTMQNVPIVATLRWFPFSARVTPYLGAGGGYMLGFVGGAPSQETDNNAQEFHALAGVNFAVSSAVWLCLEDRYQIASGDIIPIGQVQSGGNALMLGVSFILEPARDLAPH